MLKDLATGRKIGVRMTTAPEALTMVPMISSSTFMAMRKTMGEEVRLATKAPT